MGMIVEGLNRIGALWATLNTAGELGTGTASETAQDTDLVSAVSGSESTSVTTGTANQNIQQTVTFLTTSGTANGVTEFIWKTQSTDKANSRITHGAINHTGSADLIYDTEWYFKGRR